MVVGLTGGIGSGKSTVLKIFKTYNIPVYEADVEAKNIMRNSVDVQQKIKNLLGEQSYKNNELNKSYIANRVFNNKDLLTKLNEIVHPAVHSHFKKFVAQQSAPYLVYENAILFENNSEHLCDKVIVVAAELNARIERVMQRDGVDKKAVQARMNNQWSQEAKIEKADYVIYNNQLDDLDEAVKNIHQQLLKKCS